MNKKLLSLLLFVMAAFTAAFAQETLTVYEGTATNSNVPIYGLYVDAYQRSETVYDAEALAEMTSGSTITGIEWFLNSTSTTAAWQNVTFQVYMKEVSGNTISDFSGTDGATIVYEGTISRDALALEFTIPYTYQGGNLLVGVCVTTPGTYSSATFKGTTVTGASISGYNSSSLAGISPTQRNFVPMTTFTYTPSGGQVYYKPKNLQISDITPNSAKLTWEAGGEETAWNVEYKKAADEEWTSAHVTAMTYDLNALANGTDYEVRVQADYGNGNLSGWLTGTFQTPICEESDMGEVSYTLTDTYGDGWNGNKLQIVYNGTVVKELTILTGGKDEPITGTVSLCYGVDYDLVWVGASYGYECGFVLTAPDGSVIYEFQGTGSSSGASPSNGVLTTFHISQVTCPRPTALAANNVVYNGATLTWTPGDEEQDAWEVVYGAAGFNPDEATPVAVSGEATYTITGLTENTAYTAYVRGNCGEDKSIWSDPVNFTTPLQFALPTELAISDITATTAKATWTGDAENYNLRYRPAAGKDVVFSDDFENGMSNWTVYTDGEAPNTDGWYAFNAANSGIAVGAHGGGYVASAWSWSTSAYDANNWLITPQVTFGDNLSFWVATAGSWPDSYEVLLSTGGNAEEDFTVTLQAMATAPTNNQWNQVNISLADYKGQTGYIAIHHVSNDCNYLFIDDFSIDSDLEAGEWTVLENVTSPTDLEGLTPNTKYEAQVQAVYTDGTSQWTESVLFTTTDGLDVPTNLAISEITHNSAVASWEGIQDSYNLRYRTPAKADVKFFEGFEDGLDAWTLVDTDGDGINWMQFNPQNFSEGGFPAYEGQYAAMSRSWQSSALTPDQWMISPEIEDLGGTLRYYMADDGANYQETYRIYVCTTGSTDIADFEPVTDDMLSPNSVEWTEVEIDLSAYAGQSGRIAFRHYNCTDKDFMLFDAIGIYANEVPAGEWTVLENVTSPADIEGLTPETEYEVQVQGVLNGAKALTEWTASVNFTTLEAPAPEPVITLDVEFGTYTEAQTVHVTVENMPEDATIVYQLVPSTSKEEWSNYDDATGIVVDQSAALTVAVLDAEGEELARLEGEYVIDTQTGIANIGVDGYDNNAWYNLNGQKLSGKPTTPGIYINGNKKVIIK